MTQERSIVFKTWFKRHHMKVWMVCSGVLLLVMNTCILKDALGIPCPGCGLTRSTLALLMLDLERSWHFHPLTVLVWALISYSGWVWWKKPSHHTVMLRLWGAMGVLLFVVWCVRLFTHSHPDGIHLEEGRILGPMIKLLKINP